LLETNWAQPFGSFLSNGVLAQSFMTIYDLIPKHKLDQTIRHVKSAAGLAIGGWHCHSLLAAQEGFFLRGNAFHGPGGSCCPDTRETGSKHG